MGRCKQCRKPFVVPKLITDETEVTHCSYACLMLDNPALAALHPPPPPPTTLYQQKLSMGRGGGGGGGTGGLLGPPPRNNMGRIGIGGGGYPPPPPPPPPLHNNNNTSNWSGGFLGDYPPPPPPPRNNTSRIDVSSYTYYSPKPFIAPELLRKTQPQPPPPAVSYLPPSCFNPMRLASVARPHDPAPTLAQIAKMAELMVVHLKQIAPRRCSWDELLQISGAHNLGMVDKRWLRDEMRSRKNTHFCEYSINSDQEVAFHDTSLGVPKLYDRTGLRRHISQAGEGGVLREPLETAYPAAHKDLISLLSEGSVAIAPGGRVAFRFRTQGVKRTHTQAVEYPVEVI